MPLKIDLTKYKTLVFDCDGVVLNSNKTKIDAYYKVAKRMGGSDSQAQAFVDHHVSKGSFPRNGKIEYYLTNIVKQPVSKQHRWSRKIHRHSDCPGDLVYFSKGVDRWGGAARG